MSEDDVAPAVRHVSIPRIPEVTCQDLQTCWSRARPFLVVRGVHRGKGGIVARCHRGKEVHRGKRGPEGTTGVWIDLKLGLELAPRVLVRWDTKQGPLQPRKHP